MKSCNETVIEVLSDTPIKILNTKINHQPKNIRIIN